MEDRIQHGTPWASRALSLDDLRVRDADGMHGRRAVRFRKWGMNGLGLRGPAADSVAAGTRRIVTAGASETFGVYESPGREFPRQLEDTLRARAVAAGCPAAGIEVLNAAFQGMSLPTVEQDLRNRIRRYRPDVVLYYPTPAQYLEDRVPAPAAPDSSGRDAVLAPWRAAVPRFALRLLDQLRRAPPDALRAWIADRRVAALGRRRPPDWRFTAVPPERLAAYDTGLRRLVGTVRRIGAVPVLATHANAFGRERPERRAFLDAWRRFYPRATGATILAFDSAARAVTRRVAADSGVALVDVAAALDTASAGVFADFAHFTDRGSGRVAGALAATLDACPRR